ncbi:MAG: transposase family protein [Planctomycetes bacterium]|nr:transposase family protein [Planctomycetota bacterium]
MRAVAFAGWLKRQGHSGAQAARRLGVQPRTLGRWSRNWRCRQMPVTLRGRPQRMTDPLMPVVLRQHLEAMGPATGLPTLRALFPDVTRSALQDALRSYRHQWHREHTLVTEHLQWLVAAAVWASDFSAADAPIDDCYGHLLLCRDLASHYQLAHQPAVTPDGRTAVAVLEMLFHIHGAPLVLKTDNGSPFICEAFLALLNAWGVIPLLSPPRTPRYNGAVEAGGGALKLQVHYRASDHGHPGRWTSDDVAGAGLQLNVALRPWGPRGPTPQELWQRRPVITSGQRARFIDCVAAMREQIREEHGMAGEFLEELPRAAVAREAIRRALIQLGYLLVQRKRISPPFNSPLWDKIR